MRFSTRPTLFSALVCLTIGAAPTTSGAETLARDAELHAKPSARSQTLAWLAAGSAVSLEDAREGWSRISAGEWEGWVRTGAIAPSNPYCDRGYPYSGSARYFEGLTAVRTSDPLGFFLGYHVARPC